MNCKESEYLIDDYIDGNISFSEKKLLEEHISVCSNCRNAVNETLIITKKISELPKEILPKDELTAKMKQNILNKINGVNVININAESNGQADYRLLKPIRSKNYPFRMSYVLSGAAALLLLAVTMLFIYTRYWKSSETGMELSSSVYWKINKTSGTPILKNEDKNVTRTLNAIDSLSIGDWIITDNSSSAEIQAAGIGNIKLDPGTNVKFIISENGNHRIMLETGTIEADIYTSPRTFFVETKSATAIDLGCSYTMTVSENGDGVLYVKEGLVALQAHGRESLVPAGKFCMSKEGIGPGTPYSAGTSQNLKNALMKFDFQNGGDKSVQIILKNARKTDAVTLLNLMQRLNDTNKEKVYERLTEFVPPPKPYPPDSIPMFKTEELTEWIEKMQTEIRENVEKNMEELHKQLDNMKLNLDMELNDKDGKEFKYRWKHKQDNDSARAYEYNYNFNFDSLGFDKEKFEKELKKDMENLKSDLEGMNKELELNKDEIKKEMERVKEELKNMKIDIKIDVKGLRDSIKKNIDIEMEKMEKMKKEEEKKEEKTDQ